MLQHIMRDKNKYTYARLVQYFYFACMLNCIERTCCLHPKIDVTYPEDGGSGPFEHVGSTASVYLVL